MIRRTVKSASRWFGHIWNDVTSSLDASLLGTARFVGLLYGPIDRHLRINDALKKSLKYRLAPHVGWRHALGGVTYLLFMILVVTGVLLALYYRPSVEEAYPSVQHIVSEVSFGWLIRDLHVWSANLIVIAVLAHMGRVFFEAAYKPPRETNWLVGLLLLFVILAFGATGYLLPWDQWAYWTATEVLEAVSVVAVAGSWVSDALRGDVIVSGATLSRYFALHVIVLPWISMALLVYHFTLIRRRGIAPPMELAEGAEQPAGQSEGTPFFPNHLLRSLAVAVFVLAVVVSLAVLFPRPVADLADPYVIPDELVSTWVPVDVSLALIRFLGPWGLVLLGFLGIALALIPLFDRRPERQLRHRPVAAAVGLLFFVGFAVAWLVGTQIRSLPPTARPQAELVGEQSDATSEVLLPELGPTPIRPADTSGGRDP
jgi:quinol-cytochrome oxidoreductase complex cytochrome b subunit